MATRWSFAVGLTMTSSDAHLLAYAALLADIGVAASLHFVHVFRPDTGDVDDVERRMRAAVAGARGRGFDDELVTTYAAREGVRLDGMVSYLHELRPDVALVGHRSDRTGRRSLAQRLAMIGPCSVWMVPDHVPVHIGGVLIPVDFSAHSAECVTIGTGVAKLAGLTECVALHVSFDASRIRSEDHEDEVRAVEQRAIEAFVTPLDRNGMDVAYVVAESAHVSRAVLRAAADRACDLIVMGTRGRTAAASVLLGSETAQTLAESPVPVFAVKHRGAFLRLFDVLRDPKIWRRDTPQTS